MCPGCYATLATILAGTASFFDFFAATAGDAAINATRTPNAIFLMFRLPLNAPRISGATTPVTVARYSRREPMRARRPAN